MDLLHIRHAAHAAGHHRLVGGHDGQIAGAVQQADGLRRTRLQLQLFRAGDQAAIAVHRAVPVETDEIQTAVGCRVLILLADGTAQLFNLDAAGSLRDLALGHVLALVAVQCVDQAHRERAG